MAAERTDWPIAARMFLAVGFLGSYTTFSTLTVEGARLFETGEITRALVNVVGSIVVGLLAAFLGIVVSRAL